MKVIAKINKSKRLKWWPLGNRTKIVARGRSRNGWISL
jgi:hypothetical protein